MLGKIALLTMMVTAFGLTACTARKVPLDDLRYARETAYDIRHSTMDQYVHLTAFMAFPKAFNAMSQSSVDFAEFTPDKVANPLPELDLLCAITDYMYNYAIAITEPEKNRSSFYRSHKQLTHFLKEPAAVELPANAFGEFPPHPPTYASFELSIQASRLAVNLLVSKIRTKNKIMRDEERTGFSKFIMEYNSVHQPVFQTVRVIRAMEFAERIAAREKALAEIYRVDTLMTELPAVYCSLGGC